jgi:starch-binding outer membrane protein, SusD/RagB family
MKNIIEKYRIGIIALVLPLLWSCSDFLNEQVFTQYDPETFLQTESGINSVLNAAYSDMKISTGQRENMYTFNEFPGDIKWVWGGGFEAIAVPFMVFTWDASTPQLTAPWTTYYRSIRNANSLLDNIGSVTALSAERVAQLTAEARFIRAASYVFLWEMFGPVPLITTASELNLEPVRATQEEFNTFIIAELQAAANGLPLTQALWGKATRGAALALLGKYYMNTHQWQPAADVYQQVMGLNIYSLFSGDLANMFAVENEVNDEIILTSPALTNLHGTNYMAHAFPPGYPVQSNWTNFGAQYCVFNSWVQTYHPEDERLGWFLFEYTHLNGSFQNLLDPNSAGRAVRCFKYVPDPNAVEASHGNDIPMIRYAEVLLYRAEALNELIGPNQESVDLLNEVRGRAGVPLYAVSDFADTEALRDALLDELGWEFVAEGKRRLDLIRHGKLISRAVARGATNASDHMVRYPIPLVEIETNPALVQNPGYN